MKKHGREFAVRTKGFRSTSTSNFISDKSSILFSYLVDLSSFACVRISTYTHVRFDVYL